MHTCSIRWLLLKICLALTYCLIVQLRVSVVASIILKVFLEHVLNLVCSLHIIVNSSVIVLHRWYLLFELVDRSLLRGSLCLIWLLLFAERVFLSIVIAYVLSVVSVLGGSPVRSRRQWPSYSWRLKLLSDVVSEIFPDMHVVFLVCKWNKWVLGDWLLLLLLGIWSTLIEGGLGILEVCRLLDEWFRGLEIGLIFQRKRIWHKGTWLF
jgi:hypothetical protein